MLKYPITAIIPSYNESHNIVEVLKSVDFCDEVILVDSNSTDNTVELARPYFDKLLTREYIHSASQKNWAIPQATNEWIL
jgi:glycosyltransferase involved in cell wall biosynthesis